MDNPDNSSGEQALFDAIYRGDCSGVRKLLKRGGAANPMNNSWETALVYAASHGNDGCVQALLDHEAAFQTLPMVDAAVSSDATVLRRFLLMGGDPNATDSQGTTPLMETSYWGNVEVVAVLLAHGADTGIKSSGGHSVFDATEKWDCTPEARDKILSLLREASGKEP